LSKYQKFRELIITVLKERGKISTASICYALVEKYPFNLIEMEFIDSFEEFIKYVPHASQHHWSNSQVDHIHSKVKRQLDNLHKIGIVRKELVSRATGLYRYNVAYWWCVE